MSNSLLPKGFRIARYTFVFEVIEKLLLPRYKGATLRGCFGSSFQRIACPWPERCLSQPKNGCECPYGQLFAPRCQPEQASFRAGEEVARPFAISPPLEMRQEYLPGDKLHFTLTLFCRACQDLPWFLVTFRELPPIGIPPHRGRMQLKEVWAQNDVEGLQKRIYTAESPVVQNADLTMTAESMAAVCTPTQRLRLRFESPLYLRYMGIEGLRRVEFAALISRLLQRVETIASLYGEPDWRPEGWSEGARALIQAAKAISIAEERVDWFSWKRYSTRQARKVPLEGVLGETVYVGRLTPFLPLLFLGQYTQVGKGCAFGQGVYRIVSTD
jgi:hypothetical protein